MLRKQNFIQKELTGLGQVVVVGGIILALVIVTLIIFFVYVLK